MDACQIAHWAGYVCWVSFCSGVALTVAAACAIAPIVTYFKVKNCMWQWKYAAEVLDTGLSQREIKYALIYADAPKGYDVEVMLAWFESIKERKAMRDLK